MLLDVLDMNLTKRSDGTKENNSNFAKDDNCELSSNNSNSSYNIIAIDNSVMFLEDFDTLLSL